MQIANLIKNNSFPIIKANNLGLIIFSTAFTAVAVGLPFIAHQFKMAGQVFLPMQLIVLIAGLLLGWRVGLVVGVLTPLVSHSLTGMPVLPMLGLVTLEIAAYGFVAGFLRERLKFNLFGSLVLAMITGRVVLGFAALTFSGAGFAEQILKVVELGWPGILIQMAIVPFLVILIGKNLRGFETDK